MQSKDILYSAWGNDECYTPAYWVVPIIKYLPKDKIIWCPFDKENSEFVLQLEGGGTMLFIHTLIIDKIFSILSQSIGILSYQILHLQTKENFLKGHWVFENHLHS